MESLETAVQIAVRTSRNLRGRFVLARAAGDEDALQTVAARALAGCDKLVQAVPQMADRHDAWLVAVAQTLGNAPVQTLARCAVNHLHRLALTADRPVLADPRERFVGDLSDATVTARE